jgi:hypothetical protein
MTWHFILPWIPLLVAIVVIIRAVRKTWHNK